MKTLKNLIKTERLNIEALMLIKGAAGANGIPQCSSAKCNYGGCTSNVNCTGTACNYGACMSNMGTIK